MEVEKVNLLLKEKDFLKWKRAYKNCKKQRSKMVKDPYDKFVSDVKESYKRYLKTGATASFVDMVAFFSFVSYASEEYLKLDKKKKSKFYFAQREAAVEALKKESNEMNTILNRKKEEAEREKEKENEGYIKKNLNKGVDAIAQMFGVNIDVDTSKVNIDTGIENCIFSIVADVPYLKFKELTTFRIYVIITGKSSGAYRLEKLFGNYSFKQYNLMTASGNINENYKDKDFKSRKIFKACDVPIKANGNSVPILGSIVGNIDIKAKVYVSPNDIISRMAFKVGNVTVNGVKLEKILLTESEL